MEINSKLPPTPLEITNTRNQRQIQSENFFLEITMCSFSKNRPHYVYSQSRKKSL